MKDRYYGLGWTGKGSRVTLSSMVDLRLGMRKRENCGVGSGTAGKEGGNLKSGLTFSILLSTGCAKGL